MLDSFYRKRLLLTEPDNRLAYMSVPWVEEIRMTLSAERVTRCDIM
jgi:hypothetical protein